MSVLHRADGTTEYINRAEFYSFDSQQTKMIKPLVVNPGDSLNLHCVYANDGPETVSFNLGSSDEMCMEFLFYYPVLARASDGVPINFCGFMKRFWEYPFLNGTICGVDLLEKNDADFSTCNPPPEELDHDDCWKNTWGISGSSGGIPLPCKKNHNPGFQCNRTQHVLHVDEDGTVTSRWTNAIPPVDFNDLRLLPSSVFQTQALALTALVILSVLIG